MLRLLGAPDKDKHLFFWDGGHGDAGRHFRLITHESLDCFAAYLGPVR